MPEVSHAYGNDLLISPTGDLVLSSGTQEGEERVIRRLLTNSGEYIWNLPYGAGLAQFLGQPIAAARIGAVARSQMFREAAVARSPAPSIDVQVQPTGTAILTIKYADAETGTPVPLTLPVGQ